MKIVTILFLWATVFFPSLSRATALDDAAAATSVGTFTQLQSPAVTGLTATLTQATHDLSCAEGATAHSVVEYQDKGVWDHKSKKAFAYGGGHNSGNKLIEYDDATSTWTDHGRAPWAPECHFPHSYGKQALNPALGLFYTKGISQIVQRYNIATATWSALPAYPIQVGYLTGLEYFPDIGKLVSYGRKGISGGTSSILTYQEGDADWTVVADDIHTSCGDGDRALYNPRWRVMMLFPCGSQVWYIWNASQDTDDTNLVTMPTNPIATNWGYTSSQAMIVTVDPISGDVLLFAEGRQFWKFDFTTNAWSRLTSLESSVPFWGAHSAGNPDNAWDVIAIPDTSHGGVIFLTCGGSNQCTALPRMYFYKHTAASAFQTACMSAGVITCVDFDREAHFLFYNWDNTVAACNLAFEGKTSYSGSSKSPRTWPTNVFAKNGENDRCAYPKIDTSVKASGLGSLRFDVLSQAHFNSAEVFDWFFSRRGDGTFYCFSGHASCQGNTYWWQLKIRFDTTHGEQDYECTDGAGGPLATCGGHKNIIIFAEPAVDSTACCTSQIFVNNANETDIPSLAAVQGTESVSGHPVVGCTTAQAMSTGATSEQVNQYSGRQYWRPAVNPNCIQYGRNVFKTVTGKVTIGTSGVHDTRIEMWINGTKVIDKSDWRLFFGGSDGNGHGQFELLAQLTNKSNSQVHNEGKIYYDDFIVSTSAIDNLGAEATTTTYWGSVAGGAANCAAASGASDPGQYRTLAQVVSCAEPGDTIKLKNGTYAKITLTAGGNVVDGTSGNPITLTAENPGLAFIQGDGLAGQALKLVNVDWWIIENLRIENIDNAAYTGSEAQVVYLFNSNDNIIRNNIIRHPNTRGNNAAVNIQGDRNTVEANDVLQFHRNGIETFGSGSELNKIRLNYVGQTLPDLSAGGDGPNDFFVAYDSPNNTWENNIAEHSGTGLNGLGFTAWGAANKYYGNISIGNINGMTLVSAASITTGANNYVVRDQVSINMLNNGIYFRSPLNADVLGFTAHTSTVPDRGLILNDGDSVPTATATIRNAMLINTTGAVATDINTLTLSHSQEWGASSAWASGTSGRTDSPPVVPGDVDPAFGDCRVMVPAASPFKAVGFGGADIGANAIYEYVSGVKTTGRIFDHSLAGADRGKHLFGPVVVAGVNDSGTVRVTVHQRLGFGSGTCAFPSNYAGDPPVPLFTQKYFRFHGLYGTEASPAVKPHSAAAVNTSITVVKGGAFRLRLKIACTAANCPAIGGVLRYSRNGGAYTAVPNSFDANNIRFHGTVDADIPSNDTATTELLTSDHATNIPGVIRRNSSAVSFNLVENSEIEMEFALEFDSDANPTDVYQFRLYKDDAAVLDTYTVTPQATVINLTAGS